MDHVVKIKKGLDIQLKGIPSPKISNTPDSQLYAIIPDDFVGLTPKVIVKPGEKVLTGSPIIHDKTHPNIVVTSPVSGDRKGVCHHIGTNDGIRPEQRPVSSFSGENAKD